MALGITHTLSQVGKDPRRPQRPTSSGPACHKIAPRMGGAQGHRARRHRPQPTKGAAPLGRRRTFLPPPGAGVVAERLRSGLIGPEGQSVS